MRLAFERVEIERFKSIIKPLALDLHARGTGLHFVRGKNLVEPRLGSNGAGKSTLWDALCWCLTGRTPSGLKNTDVKPWSGRGATAVVVRMKVDKTSHVIERTANPNKLTLDDKPVGQEDIDALIGMNFDLLSHTILLGQGRPLFFDLSPRDKMELFSAVLDLDRWETRASTASKRAQELEREHARDSGELAAMDSELLAIDANIENLRKRMNEWEDEEQIRVAKLEKDLKENKKIVRTIQPRHDKANLALDGALAEVRPLQHEIFELSREAQALESSYQSAEISKRTDEAQIEKIEEELVALGKAKTCPTCGQPIKRGDIHRHQENLEREITDIRRGIKDPDPLRKKRDALRAKIARLTETLLDFQHKADEAQSVFNVYGPQLAEATLNIRSIETQLEVAAYADRNPFREQWSREKKRKGKLIADRRDLREDLDLLERKIERTGFWARGFKDVRLYLIEEFLQELELATNSALVEVGLVDWEIKFAIERETKSGTIQRGLTTTILSPSNRDPVRWEAWSGGEGQRLRLVGALALSDVLLNHAGIECGLEIIDEPSRHLSGEGVRDFCEYLTGRASMLGKQVFLVDHVAIESDRFASTMTVYKDAEGTRLKDA